MAIGTFGVAAITTVVTLLGLSLAVATISPHRVRELRKVGPRLKRFGGFVLIVLGLWFGYLAFGNPRFLLP